MIVSFGNKETEQIWNGEWNRLEKLSGNYKSFYSIRINNQWRILFKWNNGNAADVEIIDHH